MNCPRCGAELWPAGHPKESGFCVFCGYVQYSEPPARPTRRQLQAATHVDNRLRARIAKISRELSFRPCLAKSDPLTSATPRTKRKRATSAKRGHSPRPREATHLGQERPATSATSAKRGHSPRPREASSLHVARTTGSLFVAEDGRRRDVSPGLAQSRSTQRSSPAGRKSRPPAFSSATSLDSIDSKRSRTWTTPLSAVWSSVIICWIISNRFTCAFS